MLQKIGLINIAQIPPNTPKNYPRVISDQQ